MTLAEDTSELLKTDFQSLPLVEVLQKPPTALLSVSDQAEAALEEVGVKTIFDLALSRVFKAASQLTDAAENASNALNRFGAPASDMLSAPLPPDTRVPDVHLLSPGILAGISDTNAFTTALGVKTVRDVAFYPPYVAAKEILNQAFFPERDGAFDPEAPADLIPKSGQFPTERAQYQVLLLDEIRRSDSAAPLIDLTSPDFQPVDVSPVTAPDFGFRTIGMGALLTFNQSWFMQGVTLGHLLHSVALAPGESTRIAVVDWSRKSRAGQTEEVAETEDLLNDTAHNRSISEVTEAVAKEAQSGFSHAKTDFTTKQGGVSVGLGIAGIFKGVAGTLGIGASGSEATTSGDARGYASSSGQRNVAASMLQQISDRTHQQAHAARTRRASVVREVSQSEHEEISTRVITNYNHMHALTVQYYEVLQLFRTETSVGRADRVIFIPFRLVDFNKDDLLLRFRGALIDAALSPQVRDALVNLNMLEIAPDPNVHFHGLNGAITDALASPRRLADVAFGPPVIRRDESTRVIAREAEPATADSATTAAPAAERPPQSLGAVGVSVNAVQRRIATALWSDQLIRVMTTLGGGVIRPNSPSLFVPSDVKLIDAEVNSAGGESLSPVFYKRNGSAITNLSSNQVALGDIARVAIRGSSANADIEASVTLTLIRNSVVFPLQLPAVKIVKGATETRVVQINLAGADVNLKQELMDHQLYYSQAVFRTLDSAAIAGLLSNLSMKLNGQVVSVAQSVDPIPLRVVGNYLAFKISSDPVADAEWKDFLERRGIALGQSRVEFVPLSSGGVFAEAVLGRSNSAEKLDITRFWNWQDSPIPIQPSDIAPIVAQSRAQSDSAIAPGQLSTPIVSIQQPTALPDPTGMAGVLAAIQNGNMFRDMSGLSEMVKLAQSAIQASSAGATAAGQQASSNEQQALSAAADIFKAKLAAQSGNKNTAADKNASQQGALINEQDKRKSAEAPAASGRSSFGRNGDPNVASPNNRKLTAAELNDTAKMWTDAMSGTPISSTSSGNPALDVATFGPEGKSAGDFVAEVARELTNSSAPTPDVTNEGVPLRDISVLGNYDVLIREKEGATEERIMIDDERQLIASNYWRPSNVDLKQIVGPHRSFLKFDEILFELSAVPVGSIRTLSFVAFARHSVSLSFEYTSIFDKEQSKWFSADNEEDVPAERPFQSIRMTDLLEAISVQALPPLPASSQKMELTGVRKAFAQNAQLQIFNLGNRLTAAFIQVIANFFQVQTVSFTEPVLVLAEEIDVSHTIPPALLKSYSFGFGYEGTNPRPAHTVQRLADLLNEPSAYVAYPRRA